MDTATYGDPQSKTANFYIQATESIQERWPWTLKSGETFALFDQLGDIVNPGLTPGGIFHQDMRYLSELELRIFGQRPLLLSSALDEDNVVLTIDLSNPDIYSGGHIVVPRETLHLRRSRFIWENTCYERVAIHNFGMQRQICFLSIRTASDFADLFEIRGTQRARHGQHRTGTSGGNSIRYCYSGLDGTDRSMCIRYDPPPAMLAQGIASYEFALAPNENTTLTMLMHCGSQHSEPHTSYSVPYRAARRSARRTNESDVLIRSKNAAVTKLFRRAQVDLKMLATQTPYGPYPCAGTPWFSTPFGRDGIITALEILWAEPVFAKTVLRFLGATQATEENPITDAQPGKILHETRSSEMAVLGEVPFGKYYGSVDATPLFVLLAARYFERTGDCDTLRDIWPNVEAALNWIDSYGDLDGDGFVEYFRKGAIGLVNQGWKDSQDSIMHADGALAQGPIALCEVQGYVYAAQCEIANVAEKLGHVDLGQALRTKASILRERFDEKFWNEDLGMYALALDGDKHPCLVRSSNAGQVLLSGLPSRERAQRIADTLLLPECFSGWGIRTLATTAPRYNPMSYHNGSVWPHDNALIALGLGRFGFRRMAAQIFEGIFDAACQLNLMRLPELFCGFPRRRLDTPTLYPVACMPQAWASAAPHAFLQASLGLHCSSANEIRFEHPVIPAFLEELRISNLRIGDASVDLLISNSDGAFSVAHCGGRGDIALRVIS